MQSLLHDFLKGCEQYEYEFVKNYIESFGHKLLSEDYINCSSSLDIKCDNGHIYHKDFNDTIERYTKRQETIDDRHEM